MLDYSTFYDIAEYGNKAWRGYFTPKEVAVNAYEYLYAYEESKASGEPTETIKELARLLALDPGTSQVCALPGPEFFIYSPSATSVR